MKITAILATLSPLLFSGVLALPHTQCSCQVWNIYEYVFDFALTYNVCYNTFDGSIVSNPCIAFTNLED
jgi:hypothetical protein